MQLSDQLDPCPDVHALFVLYNQLYFDDKLGACSVQWSSKRMTRCAGTCQYKSGGGCIIRLSEPLLKFRPTKDLKETLIHEMIHAYIFLQSIRDDDGHGTQFKKIMNNINNSTVEDPMRPIGGYNISVYHTFVDEVSFHQQHQWTCQRCGKVVKRSQNRAPQQADCRWIKKGFQDCGDVSCGHHTHVRNCGGNFVKTKEPEKIQKKSQEEQQQSKRRKRGTGQKLITNFIGTSSNSSEDTDENILGIFGKNEDQGTVGGKTKGKIETKKDDQKNVTNSKDNNNDEMRKKCLEAASKRLHEKNSNQNIIDLSSSDIVQKIKSDESDIQIFKCPICQLSFGSNIEINTHLDECLLVNG